MVDYNAALPQLQQFQAPNMLAMASQANQMQLHQAQLAEVQRAAQEQNQLRSLLETGIDRNSPEFLKQVYRISPTTGMTLEKGQAELQNAALTRKKTEGELALQPETLKKAQAETVAANAKHLTEQLKNVLAYPDDERAAAAYGTLRSSAVLMHPEWDGVLPKTLDRKVLSQQVLTAEQAAQAQAAERLANQPTVTTTPGMPPMIVNKGAGTFRMAQEAALAGGAAPAIAGAAPAVAGAAPAVAGAAPAVAGAAPAVAGAAPAFDINRAKAASANIESGGNYAALGPVTKNGDRAYGKYQVMGANIPSWTKEVFGKPMTPAEFLADENAQEKVYEYQFGKNVAKYGNVADAASVWFTGKPLAQAGNVSDVLGTTAPEYVSKFMAGYGGAGAGGPAPRMMTAPQFAIPGSAPGYIQPTNALAPAAALSTNAMLAPPQQTPLSLNPSIGGEAPAIAPAAAPPRASTTFAEAEAQRQARVAAQAGATTTATKTAEAATALETAKANKKEVGQYILRTIGGEGSKKIEDLINASTSGAIQNLAAEAKGAFGTATPGKENIATLNHIAKQMTYDLLNGKLGAGISNADRDFISGLVASIADPNIPANARIKGFRQLKSTVDAWSSGKDVEIGAPATGKETTTAKPTAFTVTTPDNKVHTFPSQEALNNFKRAAGL